MRGDDERDEERPTVEEFERRHRGRMFAQHQIAADRRRQHRDQSGRDADDHQGEEDVGAVELGGLGEIRQPDRAVSGGEGGGDRQRQRVDEQRQYQEHRRRDQ